MRLREAQVPVLLWVCAAALLHVGGAQEGDQIAAQHEGEQKLRSVAIDLGTPGYGELDVDLGAVPLDVPPPPEPAPSASASTESSAEPPKPDDKPDPKAKPDPTKAAPKSIEPPKKPDPPKLPPLPKVEEKKEPDPPKKPDPPKTVPDLPKPEQQPLASVRQHYDKEEATNDDAHFLGEKNHKVAPKDEQHATITSLIQDDPKPSPGTHVGTEPAPGNSDKSVVAEDADRKGDKAAPNVQAKPTTESPKPADDKHAGTDKGDGHVKATGGAAATDADSKPGSAGHTGSDGHGATAPTGADPALTGASGDWATSAASSSAVGPASSVTAPPGSGDGRAKVAASLPVPGGKKWTTGLGFGAHGEDGSTTVSIDTKIAHAAIGEDELDRVRKVESETKLSKHRGAFQAVSLDKWRPAIENYIAAVKPGNTTELGTRAAPFAAYLAQIHVRLHPIFSEDFVDQTEALPDGSPAAVLKDQKLITRMEIVLHPDGTIDHLGIVKTSGVTMFDVAALDAVNRAGPFGAAPPVIVSPNGLVYLHWEFHRDGIRCSTLFAYPFIIREGMTPKPKEPALPPLPKLPPSDEKKPQFGTVPEEARPHAG